MIKKGNGLECRSAFRPCADRHINRVYAEQRQGRHEEHAGARETGVDKAVSVQRDDEICGAKKTQRHRRCDDRRCGDRAEPQSAAGVLLPAIGDPLEHDRWRQTYRRQVTPIRKPSPNARASMATGRSSITSASVSPTEDAASWAAFATAPARSEASDITESTFARAFLSPRRAWPCATAPSACTASEIGCERWAISFFTAVKSFSRRA